MLVQQSLLAALAALAMLARAASALSLLAASSHHQQQKQQQQRSSPLVEIVGDNNNNNGSPPPGAFRLAFAAASPAASASSAADDSSLSPAAAPFSALPCAQRALLIAQQPLTAAQIAALCAPRVEEAQQQKRHFWSGRIAALEGRQTPAGQGGRGGGPPEAMKRSYDYIRFGRRSPLPLAGELEELRDALLVKKASALHGAGGNTYDYIRFG